MSSSLWILFSVTVVLGILLSGIGTVGFIIGFVLGLVLAILAIKFFDPLVMIATSIIGASSISSGVLMLLGKSNSIILNILAFLVALALCIMIQFSMHSRKLKKKEEGVARELRDQESREKEIEEARKLLEDD